MSERERDEETRARLAAIVEYSDDAIISKTLDGIITSWNRGAEKIYGYSAEEVIGHSISILVPSDRPDEIPRILERIRRGEPIDHYETIRVAKDGSSLDISLSVSPIKDSVGNIVGASTIARDITEHKRIEEDRRQVRKIERQRMAQDLHDGALQDLTYALAEAQLVQKISKDPELHQRLQQAVEALKRAGEELRRTIYDLRLEGEEEHNFVEMLESLVELHRQSSPGREIELLVAEGFAPSRDKTTEVELLRIVREALNNARHHSQARNVRVTIGASRSKLWAEVSDDGWGFDPKGVPPGSMGISGMHKRARALGGNLKIESKPGEGTKVRFEMALKEDQEEPEEEARILLVEDHTSFRESLTSVLEQEPGFEVVGQAGSLSETRKVLDGRANVAIIDLGLPDGYGGDLIRELRVSNPQAQALVLTASLDRSEIARAVEAGAAGVLHKSAGMDEVVEAVRRLRAGEMLLPLEEVIELLRLAGSRRKQDHEAHLAIARLTPREKEVLQALAEGLDSKEIAERLRISMETERNHTASILAKLGMHSRLQALVFALRHGVVRLP